MNVIKQIKGEIEYQNITINKLAKKSCVSAGYIHSLLQNKVNPSVKQLQKIAKGLGMQLNLSLYKHQIYKNDATPEQVAKLEIARINASIFYISFYEEHLYFHLSEEDFLRDYVKMSMDSEDEIYPEYIAKHVNGVVKNLFGKELDALLVELEHRIKEANEESELECKQIRADQAFEAWRTH